MAVKTGFLLPALEASPISVSLTLKTQPIRVFSGFNGLQSYSILNCTYIYFPSGEN